MQIVINGLNPLRSASLRSAMGQSQPPAHSRKTGLGSQPQGMAGEDPAAGLTLLPPPEAKSQFRATSIGSTKNWVRSFILPYAAGVYP